MANIKELTTRIALKYDSYENWTNEDVAGVGANLVLLKGEIGICEIPAPEEGQTGHEASRVAPTVLFKVGNGKDTFKDLPWASAKAADVYGWAKKSETEFKKWLDETAAFATDAEVEAIRSGLDSRITDIENSIGKGGTVATDIADLKTRMGDAEQDIIDLGNDKLDKSTYESYIAGKELSDAALKEYADEVAEAAQSAAEGTAATALAGVKSTLEAADSALGGRIDGVSNRVSALEGTDGAIAVGDAATLEDAKAYANGLAGNYDAAGSAATAKTEAIAAAKAETESQVATAKSALEAKDAELNTAIQANATAIGNETTARGQAIEAINTKIGAVTEGKDVVTMISDAQKAAETKAAEIAQEKVTALETGTVKENTENIGKNAAAIAEMDAAYKKAVEDEAKARDDADKALDERLDKVETFFEGAYTEDGQPVKEALDTLVEIQNYITGEGEAASDLLTSIKNNADAIDNLSDRMDAAEDDIEALEAKDTELTNAINTKLASEDFNGWKTTHEADHAKTATKITEEITAAVAAETSARTTAINDINDKIGTIDGTVADAISDVSTVADRADAKSIANAGRLDTVEGKVATLETASAKHAEKTYVDEELAKKVDNDTYTQAIGNVYTKTDADAKFALASVVSENTTNIGKNASDITALTARVGKNETDIAGLVTLTSGHTTDIAALQELTKDGGVIKAAIATAQSAAETAQAAAEAAQSTADTNAENIGKIDGRVTAIENDYLKATDFENDFYVFNCGSSTEVTHEIAKA